MTTVSLQTPLHLLKTHAQKTPLAIALVAPKRSPLTYSRLYQQVNQVVTQLNSISVGCNDRVAVALPNSPEMAVLFLAVASKATCAPLNPNYRSNEFEFYLTTLQVKVLIVQADVNSPARDIAKKHGITTLELSPNLELETGIFSLVGGEPQQPRHQEFTQSNSVALVLHTSGTTSRPKIVPLTHQNLWTSANNIRLALGLKECDRCLNVMPLFHIHGLIGALLSSLSAGASVVCTPGFYAPQFFDWLEEFRPSWYSAVPTMHQAILARAETNRNIIERCQLRFIRSSSAPLPPQLIALEKVFNAPVIEAYGMTEASHQIASNPLPPQVRKPGSVGVAAGLEIAIMDEVGNLLLPLEVGEVAVRGDNITQGYDNNPEANEKAFVDGWFRTGDLGYLDSDKYLFLKGRNKEIINRGGEKISPREVDEVLLDHPAIAQAVTFAAPHTLLGEDVAAAVVLRDGTSVTEQEIKQFAAQRLADFKVPRVVIFLGEIPQGPTGKIQRIGLAETLGLTASNPTVSAEYAPPSTATEAKLTEVWADVLKINLVGIYDNFFQLGGDSILAAQIINRVREGLKVELSFLIFFQQPNVAKMAAEIARIQAEAESEELAELLAGIESLSDPEAQQLLDETY